MWGGCQYRGHLYALHMSVHPICLYAPIHPYACPSILPYTICSPCYGDLGGICMPHILGSLGASVHLVKTFLHLSVHQFAPQVVTVIPGGPHHCGLLLYWTGCLWMYAMLYAYAPFFVVFSLCLKVLLWQLWLLLLRWLLCPLVCHFCSQWLP